jgi:hypothetical protein
MEVLRLEVVLNVPAVEVGIKNKYWGAIVHMFVGSAEE